MKIFKKFALLLSVLLTVVFFGGCTINNTNKRNDLQWVIDYIEQYYLDDKDYSYSDYAKIIVDNVCDKYSAFYTKEEYESELSQDNGYSSGVGLSFLIASTDATIYSVIGNSPAENADVEAGGKVVEVAGVSVSTYNDYFIQVAKFNNKEQFEIKVDYNDEVKTFTVYKDDYKSNLVTYRDNEKGYVFTGKNADEMTEKARLKMTELPSDTFYLKFTNFQGESTVKNIRSCLNYAKQNGKTRVVLDLRGNGGGYVSMMSEISSFFIDGNGKKALTSVAKYKNGEKELYYTPKDNYYGFGEVYILANEYSASASESLIGVLFDYKVSGYDKFIVQNTALSEDNTCKTYGKGIMQGYFTHQNTGDVLKMTIASISWPISDTCIHGVGVIAKVENSTTTDEQTMNRLVELLNK